MFELLIDAYKKAESRKEILEHTSWFREFTKVVHEIWNKLDLPEKTFTYNDDLWFYVSKRETKTNIITCDLRQIVEEDVIRYLDSLYR